MPEEVHLVIEVADTSVEYDRGIKMPLYARSGIAETWIVDLNKEVIEVYKEPLNNTYKKTQILKRGDELISQTIPGVRVKLDEVF
jgi:Uma2 family endonuclease